MQNSTVILPVKIKILVAVCFALLLYGAGVDCYYGQVMPRQPTPDRQVKLHASHVYLYVTDSEFNRYQIAKYAGVSGLVVCLIVVFGWKAFSQARQKMRC